MTSAVWRPLAAVRLFGNRSVCLVFGEQIVGIATVAGKKRRVRRKIRP